MPESANAILPAAASRSIPGWALALGLAAILGGCGSGSDRAPAQGSRGGSPEASDPVEAQVPAPPLDGIEPLERQHLEEERVAFEQALARPDASKADRARAYGRLGMVYHAYGLPEALVAYRNAESLDPRVLRWPYYQGRLAARLGEVAEAVSALERAVDVDPGYLPAWIELGRHRLALQRLAAATAAFERALALQPASAPALAGVGEVLHRLGDSAAAIEVLERALSLTPGADRIHHTLGMAYRDSGDLERARWHLERAGEVRPAPPDPLLDEVYTLAVHGERIHEIRAARAFRQGNLGQAVAELQRGLARAPDSPSLRLNLGAVLTEVGDLAGAARELESALSSIDDPALERTARFNLGTVEMRRGRFPEAIRELGRALELDPSFDDARLNLGHALVRSGRSEEGAAHYRRLVEANPAAGAARAALASVQLAGGSAREALSLLEAGYELDPHDPHVQAALARILATAPERRLRDGERAAELGRQAFHAETTLENAEILAFALAETGQFEEAAQLQEATLTEARRVGRSDLTPRLEENLAHYRQQRTGRSGP